MKRKSKKLGGFRPGSGRKPTLGGPTVTKAVRLPAEIAKKIEESGENFSDVVRNLLSDNGYGESGNHNNSH